jgi:hypothetical protein
MNVEQDVLIVVNDDTGKVAGVFMPGEKVQARNLASRLYEGSKSGPYASDGEPWLVVDGTVSVTMPARTVR